MNDEDIRADGEIQMKTVIVVKWGLRLAHWPTGFSSVHDETYHNYYPEDIEQV